MSHRCLSFLQTVAISACFFGQASAGLTTWDGRHSIDQIDVTVVYFVPRDRNPLPDWRERVDYYCRRIERFHQREFQGQSTLRTQVRPEPFRSARTSEQLRAGEADFIFFQTLGEVDSELKFGRGERTAYPILLVLSEINWRPLDDFFRLKTTPEGKLEFEGHYSNGRHFPGAASGGARATYLADRGVGWGLVSADGWRVPYCGTDCVVYHEGVGHAVGLPHPEPGNGSVMSFGQYRGWISESFLDDEQKRKLGWKPGEQPISRTDLYSRFRALPDPVVPKPDQTVNLKFDWPDGAQLKSCRIRMQTELSGPWIDVETVPAGAAPQGVTIGRFDRATPVSYRVDAELNDGQTIELWGYFQVRSDPNRAPQPLASASAPEAASVSAGSPSAKHEDAIDLLALIDPARDAVSGTWITSEGRLESPKQYGARIEIPYRAPDEYELTAIVEPLDAPNGLILGQRSGGNRFLVLVNFAQEQGPPASALENIDGLNVGRNATTISKSLLEKGRLSQVICTIRKSSVSVTCDGREIIRWIGDGSRLSLSDYWSTPTADALFLGAYDCRYRVYRLTLAPITGSGKSLRPSN